MKNKIIIGGYAKVILPKKFFTSGMLVEVIRKSPFDKKAFTVKSILKHGKLKDVELFMDIEEDPNSVCWDELESNLKPLTKEELLIELL